MADIKNYNLYSHLKLSFSGKCLSILLIAKKDFFYIFITVTIHGYVLLLILGKQGLKCRGCFEFTESERISSRLIFCQ